jgi:hypothetical protein
MTEAIGERTRNEGLERRAALLLVVEIAVLVFAGLPAAVLFLVQAAAWEIGLYLAALVVGLASFGSTILVFRPGADSARKAKLLFWAFVLLFAALILGSIWVVGLAVAGDPYEID